jgi:hypothetical protein
MIFFTICNLNYLDRVITLSNSLKKNNKDALFILCLVEKSSSILDYSSYLHKVDYDILITPDDLEFNNLNKWIFSKDIITASTGLKAKFFKHIFNLNIGSKIIYLDPDLEIFSSFSDLGGILDYSDIVLTPHLIKNGKEVDLISEHEYSILRHGIFNLGFLGLAKSNNSFRFLDWWDHRLELECVVDFSRGIFTDQKWIDQVPVIFEKVTILGDGNYNLSTWNVNSITFSISNEQYFVNGQPLIFIHHSGSGQKMRHDQIHYSRSKHFVKLCLEYESRVLKNREILDFGKESWSYDYFDYSSERISNEEKMSYTNNKILKFVKNPYSSNVYKALKIFSHISKVNLINYVRNTVLHNKYIFRDRYQGSRILFYDNEIVVHKDEVLNYYFNQFNFLMHLMNPRNPIIIHITHGLGGGVDKHVNELISYTNECANNLVIYPIINPGDRVEYHIYFEDAFNSFELDFNDFNELVNFLKFMPAAFIHFHHTMNFSESLIEQLGALGFSYGITFHDFFFLTTNWELINENSDPVEISNSTQSDTRLEFFKDFVLKSKFTISPSNFVRHEYSKRGFQSEIENFTISHLESNLRIHSFSVVNNLKIDEIRLAILGDIGPHKGLGKIFEILEIDPTARPKLIMFGSGPIELTGSVDEYRGRYEDKSIVQKILNADINAIWLPFQSKETFSYILGKSMNTGLHIFTTSEGALSERLINYPNSTLMNANSSAEEFIQIVKSHFNTIEVKSFDNKSVPLDYELSPFYWYRNTYINFIKSFL